MKAGDENCVPLCMTHHNMLHMMGNEQAFFEEMVGDPEYGKTKAKQFWDANPNK